MGSLVPDAPELVGVGPGQHELPTVRTLAQVAVMSYARHPTYRI